MKGTVFVIGGARSGKSAFAEALAGQGQGEKIYVATAQERDGEMAERIKAHQARRGNDWRTVEEPLDLPAVLDRETGKGRFVLVDCLTLWLSNLMENGLDTVRETDRLCASVTRARGMLVLVTNEVGQGIVPANELARRFRDEAGRMNQKVAAACNEAHLVVAGLGLRLK